MDCPLLQSLQGGSQLLTGHACTLCCSHKAFAATASSELIGRESALLASGDVCVCAAVSGSLIPIIAAVGCQLSLLVVVLHSAAKKARAQNNKSMEHYMASSLRGSRRRDENRRCQQGSCITVRSLAVSSILPRLPQCPLHQSPDSASSASSDRSSVLLCLIFCLALIRLVRLVRCVGLILAVPPVHNIHACIAYRKLTKIDLCALAVSARHWSCTGRCKEHYMQVACRVMLLSHMQVHAHHHHHHHWMLQSESALAH